MAVLRWWCVVVLAVVVHGQLWVGYVAVLRWGAWPFWSCSTSEERVAVLGVGVPVLQWLACGVREVHRNMILF